jgi:hypothetical protein
MGKDEIKSEAGLFMDDTLEHATGLADNELN